MSDMRRILMKTLKEKKLTLAMAESVTCGLAAHRLSTLPGVSDVMIGSIVCYTPEIKISLLKVPKKMINKYTCESAQVTRSLVQNLRKLIKSDLHIAVTGLASPGGSETKSKPVGTIFISVSHKGKIINKRFLFRGSPVKIRTKACDAMYETLYKLIG